MPEKLYCTGHVLIRNGKIIRNGETVLSEPRLSPADFLRACYDATGASYPKFFKMDALCKLAWAGAELLQKGTRFVNGYAPERKGIFLQNTGSSLDTDLKHAESIASPEAYFPSPAVFVYTLPNIAIGEICIRQQVKGSSAFFIFEAFDADFLYRHVHIQTASDRIDACIAGRVEYLENRYELCLFMVEKSPATEGFTEEWSVQNMNSLYTQS